MVDYSRRQKSDNDHLRSLTSAKFVQIDGGVTTPIVITTTGCNLNRVTLNTNGSTVRLMSGSREVGQIASDAPEGTFWFGVYCENGLTVTAGGAVDATIVYDT